MNETPILDRLRQGDLDALAALVRAYQERALRTAYLITQDRMLAQDVVQDAFVRAYERRSQIDPARPFGPWFLRVVVNAAVKAARKEARAVSLDDPGDSERALADLLADPAPGPEDAAGQRALQAAVQAALLQLSPPQRAVIVLRYYLGYTENEIAAQLQRPPGTIKSRLYAARQRLAGLLRGHWIIEPEWESKP